MTKQRKRLGLTVPKTLYQKIADKAEYHGKTLNAMCLEIFWDYFENKKVSESDTEQKGE